MYTFQFDIPANALIFFGIAVFLIIPVIFIYFRPLWRVSNAVKRSLNEKEPSADVPVSVIVFASDEAEALRHLLPSILGQRYNGPFEVIVVNEGQSDSTVEVVERLRQIHNNLYLTYTPDGARQLSRKKLALMIGIKAARYPVVVQTTAAAVITSDEWLARMTQPFSEPSVEVVLGSSCFNPAEDTGFGRRSRIFNSTADAVNWLSAALDGKPYRGTELNLAYTREAFFRNRGFSKSLNLKYGDDDIFINEIANGSNTAIVLHPDSKVCRAAFNARRTYNELRSRYNFTGRYIPRTARRLQALGAWLMWCIVGLCVCGALITWPNLAGACLGVSIVLVLYVTGVVYWRKAIKALSGKRMCLSLPFLMMTRPFANMISKMKSLRYRKRNYTWTK